MPHRLLTLLLPLLLCTCGRDPLSIETVELDLPGEEDSRIEITLLDEGPVTGTTTLVPQHGDLTLNFTYRLDNQAEATLNLQGCHSLDLRRLSLADSKPKMDGALAVAIWHDLELVYATGAEGAAVVPELYLDGNLLHYQLELPACNDPGPTTLDVRAGEVEITDARYNPLAGNPSVITSAGDVLLNVPLLKYITYELPAQTKNFGEWEREPTTMGYINRFHMAAVRPPGADAFAAAFTGPLEIPVAGQYTFRTWGPSAARLYVDDQEVLSQRGDPHYEERGTVELTEGTHDFRLEYIFHGGWDRFDLAYTLEGQKERYLNTMEEDKIIAAPGTSEPLVIETDERPYILRSFAYFPTPRVYQEATKRTHVVSVGEGQGPHYSVDLQTGALLQMWRGEFADVQDMWVGRGEPQVMRPLGRAVAFDGRPQWAASPDGPWPETLEAPDKDNFQHRAYELDDDGRPTFFYEFGDASVSDYLTPDGNGLLRELTYSAGGGEAYTVVASARGITETAPGEYQLRGPGLNISITSYDGDGLFLQRGGGTERLIAHMEPAGHLRYRLDW